MASSPFDYSVEERLAVYGSLRPGGANAHVLEPLRGIWADGSVRGRLLPAGWGAAAGYPGIRLDAEGETVAVSLFCSSALPGYWERLDAFEGPDYRRRAVEVALCGGGQVHAQIYELTHAPDHVQHAGPVPDRAARRRTR